MARGRKTGGRTKGTPNKTTAEVKKHAQQYDKESIDLLMAIGRNVKADEKARVMALKEVLDRGHGKSPQAVEVDHDHSGSVELVWQQ